jgi:L-threonylcarbamoyladenylate synthase
MTDPNIRKISCSNPAMDLIDSAVRILKEGGIVVAPTETRYGVLGRIDNEKTVEKIYRLKKRVPEEATAIFVRSREEISRFAYENENSKKLSQIFLPGPLTLVLRDKSGLPAPIVVDKKIGIRYSPSKVIMKILAGTDVNLTATSANISGNREAVTISEISQSFGLGVDLYLDSGRLDAQPSTVVDCSGKELRILREGAIAGKEIKEKAAQD